VRAIGESRAEFDVYHAGDGISANALATLTESGRIPGFVRTVHHVDTFADPDLDRLQLRALRGAAQTYVVSALWQRRLAAAFGIAAEIVPNGVDTARFSPVSSAERARLRAEAGFAADPLFLAIGGIEERKNTIATLDAFALVRRSQPRAVLAIAGGASVFDHSRYRARFETRATGLGLRIGSDVRILGPLPDDAIVALLRAAHALVLPSLVEGFGLVALEALASETPLVTSRIAPFTEYLTEREALFADPRSPDEIAAAMLAALDGERAAALARFGADVARRFGWDESARVHLARYRAYAPRLGDAVHA
jgi:glycosyltransferase-like protein